MAVNYQLQDTFLSAFYTTRFAEDFYLTGGTALARYYFHHRESVDLDLFTQHQTLDFAQVNQEIILLSKHLGLTLDKQVVTGTFLQYIYKEGLKVDLVKDIPVHFGAIKIEGGVRIDSLENIGSNKVLAIFGRTEAKDFIDLYFLLQETEYTLDHLYTLATKKDVGLTEFYLAYAMDKVGEATNDPVMLRPYDREKAILFYKEVSKKLFLKIKPQ
ncbi:nucleotidyl transferase AbiEii/AbiGii toxin family protein [Candidatus Gottesmanbacteria bacterium]|nr:nucleotidyl transferase AbiEii/AbiGii toxin family protein [Candidatus Gottesmanbacteria bacterium]